MYCVALPICPVGGIKTQPDWQCSSTFCATDLTMSVVGTGFADVFATVTSALTTARTVFGAASAKHNATTTVPPIAIAILRSTFMFFSFSLQVKIDANSPHVTGNLHFAPTFTGRFSRSSR
jgi:hypothetical protein